MQLTPSNAIQEDRKARGEIVIRHRSGRSLLYAIRIAVTGTAGAFISGDVDRAILGGHDLLFGVSSYDAHQIFPGLHIKAGSQSDPGS